MKKTLMSASESKKYIPFDDKAEKIITLNDKDKFMEKELEIEVTPAFVYLLQ